MHLCRWDRGKQRRVLGEGHKTDDVRVSRGSLSRLWGLSQGRSERTVMVVVVVVGKQGRSRRRGGRCEDYYNKQDDRLVVVVEGCCEQTPVSRSEY